VVEIADCAESELRAADILFAEQIFPVLTPLAVGPGRPFPYISNLSLSIGVFVHDPVSGMETFARVKVPKEVLPRFVPIGDDTFIPLEAVIARHLDELPRMEILRHDCFPCPRDADFTVSTRPTPLQAWRTSCGGGASARWCARGRVDHGPDMREYLIEQLATRRSRWST
jgi:polyphosphate kinase